MHIEGIPPEFWRKVNTKVGTMPHMSSPCWIWKGWIHGSIGRPRWDGMTAARFVLLRGGAIEGAWLACHHCDNPACVRPDHLYAGTSETNRKDRVDRRARLTGEAKATQVFVITMALPREERDESMTARRGAWLRMAMTLGIPLSVISSHLSGRPLPVGAAAGWRAAIAQARWWSPKTVEQERAKRTPGHFPKPKKVSRPTVGCDGRP